MSKSILVFGATGKQGGAVVRALVADPSFSPTEYTILAVTRNTESASARRLAELSPAIKIVQGDWTQAAATFEKLPSQPWGVYTMTMPGKNEVAQGIAIAEEAVRAGAQHFVFSSVDRGPGQGPSEVPHFLTKHAIEERIFALAKENESFAYTIIRPPFFLDNLNPGMFGKIMATVWRDNLTPDSRMAVVDTKDVGRAAATALLHADDAQYRNQALDIAGDKLTFGELNEKFVKYTGDAIPTTFAILPSAVLFLVSDVAKMVKFMQAPGFAATPEESKKVLPELTGVDQWLEASAHPQKQEK